MLNRIVLIFALGATLAAQPVPAPQRGGTNAEQRAAAYMESVRANPLLLAAFLRAMPKGGDLHNHLSGAVYAESYIQWAAQDGVCVDRKTLTLVAAPCDDAAGKPVAAKALTDPVLYRELIDAFSMRHFSGALQSGHDHFFDSFAKFGIVSRAHQPEMLAEVVSRAGSQNMQYMELLTNLSGGRATALGQQLGWDDDFDRFRQNVDSSGAAEIVAAGRKFVDEIDAGMRRLQHCDEAAEMRAAGCNVTVRYIQEIYRGLPREMVFAQTQIAFELAAADPRVVSVNPVMPEDAYVPMHDFDLHMRIFAYFHKLYPHVRLTMHAGELAPKLVPLDGLSSHIRKTVAAGATRIGHGDDVMWEDRPFELLREMREKNVLVEICLTSNDYILGVRAGDHPLPVYLKYGVPVALATDDEGVSRSDITHEYLRAVQTYGFKYPELKKLAGNSIEHAFADDATRAKLKQQLESAFVEFEKSCCGH